MSTWTDIRVDEYGNPLEQEGATWYPYEMERFIVSILYEACKIGMIGLKILAEFIDIMLPSGLCFRIWDGTTVPDFRLEVKRYWCASIKFMGLEICKVPLPKVEFKDLWRAIVQPINPPFAGSENYRYRDYDGEIRYGYECTPPRTYGPLTEGLVDVGTLALIVTIVTVLMKAGVFETALEFVKGVMLKMRTRKLAKGVDESNLMLKFLTAAAEKSKLEKIDLQIMEALLQDIPEIKAMVGLRMALR